MLVLAALEGRLQAQLAVGLTYFAGLRPGEARGVCWEDYDGYAIQVRTSVWRTYRTEPKTPNSIKPVQVIEPLRTMFAQLRAADGDPRTGPILRGTKCGRPLHLDNLAHRVIRPLLRRCVVCHRLESEHADNGHGFELDTALLDAWKGAYYSKRRSIGTLVTAVAKDQGLAAKGLMRNTLGVAQSHYIKSVPEETQKAMGLVEQLFAGNPHRA
jgi:hypothetical protein